MNWWRVTFGGVGAVATALGLALLSIPGAVAVGPVETSLDAVERIGSERVLLAVGIGVLAYLGFALRTPDEESSPDAATRRFERFVDRPPGTVTSGVHRITATDLDEGIDNAIERGGEPLAVLRERLRTTVVSVYAEVTNTPEGKARTAVDRGEWCRDPVATAFLAGPDGPTHSLTEKLRLLAFPARERRRRVERTMIAIEQLEYA